MRKGTTRTYRKNTFYAVRKLGSGLFSIGQALNSAKIIKTAYPEEMQKTPISLPLAAPLVEQLRDRMVQIFRIGEFCGFSLYSLSNFKKMAGAKFFDDFQNYHPKMVF